MTTITISPPFSTKEGNYRPLVKKSHHKKSPLVHKDHLDDSKTPIEGWSQSHGSTSFYFSDNEDDKTAKSKNKKNLLRVDHPKVLKKSNFNYLREEMSKYTIEMSSNSLRTKDAAKKGSDLILIKSGLENEQDDLNIKRQPLKNPQKQKRYLSAVDLDAKIETKGYDLTLNLNLKENSGSSNEDKYKIETGKYDLMPNSARNTKAKKFLLDVDTDLSAQNTETLNASNLNEKKEISLQTWKKQLKLSTLAGGDEGLQLFNLHSVKTCKTERTGMISQNQYPILHNNPPLTYLKNVSSECYSSNKKFKAASHSPPLRLVKFYRQRAADVPEEKGQPIGWRRAIEKSSQISVPTTVCTSPRGNENILLTSPRVSEAFKKEKFGGGFLLESQIKKKLAQSISPSMIISENSRPPTTSKKRDLNPLLKVPAYLQTTEADIEKKIYTSILESPLKDRNIPVFKKNRGTSLQIESLEDVVQKFIKDSGNSSLLQKCESARNLASEKILSLADIKSARQQSTSRIVFPPAKPRQTSKGPKEVIMRRRKPGENFRIKEFGGV